LKFQAKGAAQEIKTLAGKPVSTRKVFVDADLSRAELELKKFDDIINGLIQESSSDIVKTAIDPIKPIKPSTKKDIETVSDVYKEINDDLDKIAGRRDLNPLEKSDKSIERIKQGLDYAVDKFGNIQFDDERFKKLEERLSEFKSIKVGLELEKIKSDLKTSFKLIEQRGSVLNIDVSVEKIKEAESAIDKLINKYLDETIPVVKKDEILNDINVIQSQLRQLNLDVLVGKGEYAFKELSNDVSKLSSKQILLGVSTNKEALKTAKDAVDKILDIKIQLISEGDIARAEQLNDELQRATSYLAAFKSLAITERFNEYKKKATEIKYEFEQISKKLPATKKLELKIETDKKLLDEVTKTIDDEIANGISPIDPRILFLKILKGNLKVGIELDEDKKKKLEEDSKFLQESLSSGFASIGESIGTAIAEGGNIGAAFGKSVMESLGSFLQELGKRIIVASELISKAQALLGTTGGIFAGIGLVTLGAIIKGLAGKGFASGGFVSGDGTSTSDSIPARLSNGEYVINAKSVRRYGKGFFDRINQGAGRYSSMSGTMNFAMGGAVSNWKDLINKGGANVVMGNESFNSTVAETIIKGQDLKLILKRADRRFNNSTAGKSN
jgi:hypothetical protein